MGDETGIPENAADETRADTLKAKLLGPQGLGLHREFAVRALRTLMHMNGVDPQVGPSTQLPDFRLADRIGYEAIILDATGAPYRSNPKSFRVQASLGVGSNGLWELGLFPPQTGQSRFYAAIVIDSVHYRGASDVTYGKGGLGNLVMTDANRLVLSEEEAGASFPPQPGSTPTQEGVPTLQNIFFNANTGSGPPASTAYHVLGFLGSTPAAGPPISELFGDLVIFPSEMVIFSMDTAATAGRLMIHGRYFDLPQIGTGQLPS